jgi:hypothetical protein
MADRSGTAPRAGGVMKKRVPIDVLLTWVYRDELPKQTVGELTGWEKLIYLGTTVDETDRGDGGLPIALGPPHPDALMLAHAVKCLEPMTLRWPHARSILAPDIGACIRDDDPSLHRLVEEPAYLLRHHAIMITQPEWHLGAPRLIRTTGPNGKPVVDGITAGGRYAEGANCPLLIEPSGAAVVKARFEYLVWWMALTKLVSESWNYRDHILERPRAAQAPWITGPERSSRILPTIIPSKAKLFTASPEP